MITNHDYEPGENTNHMETDPLCAECNGSYGDHGTPVEAATQQQRYGLG